jgi:hypothetical protein
MYQHTTLIQNLNDSKLAEARRQASRRRDSDRRPEQPRRVTRPLARLFSH